VKTDGKDITPAGFSIPHKAPIFSGVFLGHDEQAPLFPHALQVSHIGFAKGNYYY